MSSSSGMTCGAGRPSGSSRASVSRVRGNRVCQAEPQATAPTAGATRAHLGAAALCQLDRHGRVAVDASLDVVDGLAVAQQDELGGAPGRPGRLAAPGRLPGAREEGARCPPNPDDVVHPRDFTDAAHVPEDSRRRGWLAVLLLTLLAFALGAHAGTARGRRRRSSGAVPRIRRVGLAVHEGVERPRGRLRVVRRARREDRSTWRPAARTRRVRSRSPTRRERSSTRPTRPVSTSSRGTTRRSGGPISTLRDCSRRPATRARRAGRSTASASTSRTRRSRSSRAGTSACSR